MSTDGPWLLLERISQKITNDRIAAHAATQQLLNVLVCVTMPGCT
jgi:hypothetical protein